MNEQNNPYAPPVAAVLDDEQYPGRDNFILGGRVVPAGNGWTWITDAWQMFMENAGVWILIYVALVFILMVAGLVPCGTYLATPLLLGGLMLGCERARTTGRLEFGDLFSAFSTHAGPLVIQGLLTLAGVFIITIPIVILSLFVIFLMSAMGDGSSDAMGGMLLLFMLLISLLVLAAMLPLIAAMWFAPVLIVLHDRPPLDAMKESFRACFKNWLPMTVYSVVAMLAMIVAMLPCFLGLLVAGPVLCATMYTSYRDIFIEQ